jgi:Tfp pilus assembly protein PilX
MNRFKLSDLRREDGIAVAVAIILMAFMLSMGVAAAAYVDAQSSLTAKQRQRETAFNVAEAALNAQITQISHHWAGTNGLDPTLASTVSFTQCPGGTFCPSGSELTSLIPSADTSTSAVTWQTNVYDDTNGLESYFADSRVSNQCGCDGNGDGKVWVRAQATVKGHTRAIVSLVQEQTQAESVPHAAIIAGSLTIENNGQHSVPIIDDSGGGVIAVRCSVPNYPQQPAETNGSQCLGQPLGTPPTQSQSDWSSLLTNQISGFSTALQGYSPAPVFSQDQLDRFINTAKAESTYYTSCPSSLAGQVVVVNMVGNCTYTGSDEWNTSVAPGFLIFLNAQSTLTLGGTTIYHGVIYHANEGSPPTLGSATQSSASLIITSGNTLIDGGVIIDGPGRMDAGESGLNIQFNDHGYDAVKSLAAAGIVQNSWREIQPGQ